VIEPLLFSVTRVSTFAGATALTAASGFFFERDGRLFLITARHVLFEEATGHRPDRIQITLHTDPEDLSRSAHAAVPLYRGSSRAWRQAVDSGGEVDVAAIELEPAVLPAGMVVQPFTPAHLQERLEDIGIGTPVLVLGFPLGFYDTLHNLPVVRQAVVASAFGVRFQGLGYFLTDARMHRGSSGSPVVLHHPGGALPWKLLGIHSAALDMRGREQGLDESLGLNCAWYADILRTLTDP
jgi:S1-C subfamily serine protease